jgi:cysteine desulfuration protein SufE
MSVTNRQKEIIANYDFIENYQERLGAIVDAARHLPSFEASLRTETNLVPGCTSRVWLTGECREGHCHFRADCDSPLVRGLVILLAQAYDGGTPAEVWATSPIVLEELGVWRDLTPTRQNGLTAVRQRIAELAQGWIDK